jgi:hypothetical protein
VARDAGLKRLREKHYQTSFPQRPSFVEEESWAIFTAYVYEERSLRYMRERRGMPLSRLRQVLYEVDTQLERSHGIDRVGLQSAIEKLELSNRARNALHRLGCRTVNDVLQLDLSGTRPRVGGKSRMEVLVALQSAGFRHPSINRDPAAGVTSLARSLERMQERINVALRSVEKEVGVVQRQLQDWLKE